MTRKYRWRPFLDKFNHELLADGSIRARLPPNTVKARWLGFPPASAKELAKLESRLGTSLPESYRQFLATTNGWHMSGPFIYDVWPTHQVDWLRDQRWIDWGKGPQISVKEHCTYGKAQDCCAFRASYLKSCLQISAEGDFALYLLNPKIRTKDGEWEAWFLAGWLPGAVRYRSFWELMQQERRGFLRKPRKKSGKPIDALVEQVLRGMEYQGLERAYGRQYPNEYCDSVSRAIQSARRRIAKLLAHERLTPTSLEALKKLADHFEARWLKNARPGVAVSNLTRLDGTAEGCRVGMYCIHAFLHQAQRAR